MNLIGGVNTQPARPTEKTWDVVAIGEAMVEFNQQDGAHYLAGFGGDTSNCVIAAARMGARTAYLSQVGDDVWGDELLALWRREGINTEGVRRLPGGQTGLYFVTHGAQGHRFSYRRSGSAASRMAPDTLPAGAVDQAQWLHCSGISQAISDSACDTVFAAIARARAAGTQVSYDLNFRPDLWPAARALAIAKATLAQCDVFFPSIDEVSALAGLHRPEDVIAWSHAQGVPRVALKLGALGCRVSSAEGVAHIAAHPVNPVDASGAGDCFAGALLARLAAGDALADAARAANVAAALSTQGYGAVKPLPTWAEVAAVLRPGGRPGAGD